MTDGGDRRHILQHADLVVGVHERYQRGLRPQRFSNRLGRNETVAVGSQIGHRTALLLEALGGIEHRFVLEAAGHQMPATRAGGAQGTQHRKVIGLGRSRSPHQVGAASLDQCGEFGARLLDTLARTLAEVMHRGGIAERAGPCQALAHGRGNALIHRRGGGVIEIQRRAHTRSRWAPVEPAWRRRCCTEVRMPRRMLTSFASSSAR